jgi:hypothetical protein
MDYDLDSYLRENFSGLVLGGALLYSWPIAIRFDLGGRAGTLEDFTEVQRRATALFESIFVPGDVCIVVSQDWPDCDTPHHGQTHLSVLSDFGINQSVGLRPQDGCIQMQDVDGVGICTLTWFVQAARDFQYRSILEGIANADHARFPALSGRIYFVNPLTNVIMHMYDDRGLDVIATTKPALAPLYRDFKSWVLDYDRNRIGSLFDGQ